ncbi:MAG: exodeoxyribonuclease III [Bacteroidia bacterium]
MKRIITYNVNGIRSAIKKGFIEWLKATKADIVCLQEIKVQADQLDLSVFEDLGFHPFLHSAQKKGYSGIAILSKNKPDNVEYGCGMDCYDMEGRIIRADYGDVSVLSVYFPSGSSGELRQKFKMQFLDDFNGYVADLKRQRHKLIICGDWNICHQKIDIHNPVSNARTSGFLPEERQWLDEYLKTGFVDVFRHFNQDPHQYTWWSQRVNARQRNLGWRIDYHIATENLINRFGRSVILSQAVHSDHCPVLSEVDL